MKETMKIEHVRVGDVVDGRKVVEVLHRTHADYVRLVLEGGWPIIHGSSGKLIEVKRPAKTGSKGHGGMDY